MAKYIDKDTLVEEIEILMTPECGYSMNKLIDFLESLEVKEVDIEKEIEFEYNPIDGLSFEEFERIAKYFFELGLKSQKGE